MAIQRSPAERLASLLGAHMHDPKLSREYLSALGFELPAEGWDPEREDFPEHLFLEWLEADPTGDRSQTAVAVARKLGVAPEEMEEVEVMLSRSGEPGQKAGGTRPVAPEGEPKETDPAELERGPTLAGYVSDAVGETPDLLGIEHEVDTIARVLASSDVAPPLSLGLFGDWGSGKSFFMEKLQGRIAELAVHARDHERETGERAAYCSRVVQVRFNAWHYSDSNLWATLVTSIFEALYDELDGASPEGPEADAEQRRQIEAELARTEGLVKAANAQLAEAQKEVRRAETDLRAARTRRLQKQSALRDALESVPRLLVDDPATLQRLRESGEVLGVLDAAESYDRLREHVAEIRTFSGRLARVGRRFLDDPFHRAAIPLLLAILLLPVGVHLASVELAWINDVVARLAESITFLAGLLGWVGLQIQRVNPHLEALEESVRTLEERRREQERETAGEHRELEILKEREEGARRTLERAQQRKQTLEQELEELRPDQQLKRLLEDRVRDERYAQHLGIVSLIRKDFEAMSDLLSRRENFDPERPGIQRIVLYIDDLDRCRHQQVVQVLEAVHMLMAFELFVVVVGVDPRWLRSALRRQYPHLTSAPTEATSGPVGLDPLGSSSPQEYLEKIFQIPFALRPIREKGYRSLVRNLLAEDVGEPDVGPSGVETPLPESLPHPEAPDSTPIPETEPGHGSEDGDGGPEEVDLGAHPLRFTERELTDIESLAPLFGTPRSVKRFVNCYRLLKASVGPAWLERFQGSAGERPGEYRAALVVLAALTGTPDLAPRLLARLQAWRPDGEAPEPDWDAFLDHLLEELSAAGENGDAPDPVWRLFCRDLDRCTRGRLADIDFRSIRAWAARSARFSFAIKLREQWTDPKRPPEERPS